MTNIVMNSMDKHIRLVGREQAIRDLQTGLNILNKGKKDSIAEDGDYGNQTHACLANVCKDHSPQTVSNYIRRGAVTNAIFDTKNNKKIDTERKIEQIYNDLKIERRK